MNGLMLEAQLNKPMIIVVFEFTLHDGVTDRYFELAGMMREEIQNQAGFISIERFRHIDDEHRVVSISTWESEDAIKSWRENLKHRMAQKEGKAEIFKSYRLRVAEVKRDYGMTEKD